MISSCTFLTLFFFLALSCRSISVPFSLKKSAKCEIASPSLRSSGSSSSTHKYGKHMAPFKRPIFEQSSRFSAFPPSPKKNSFFVLFSALLEKVQRSGTCVCPSVTSQMISLPSTPAPDCCTLLWWVIYTDVFNCAGGPYFYALFLRLRLRFYSSVAFSSPLCCCYKKILSTDSSSSGRFSSGVSAVIVGKL